MTFSLNIWISETTCVSSPFLNTGWSDRGVVDDENMPFRVAEPERTQRAASSAAGPVAPAKAPWTLRRSVFAPRGRVSGFYNDDATSQLAFDKDWALCEQKRTFRAMVNRVEGNVLAEVKSVMRSSYALVDEVYCFYASLDEQSGFTMRPTTCRAGELRSTRNCRFL